MANSISCNEEDPAVVRICNVNSDGFDIRIQEWGYLDGNHNDESINYIVLVFSWGHTVVYRGICQISLQT